MDTVLVLAIAFCLWRLLALSHRVQMLERSTNFLRVETDESGELPSRLDDLEERVTNLELFSDLDEPPYEEP